MPINQDLIDSLSPLEIKIIPYLNESIEEIAKKTGLDMVSLLRGLRFLENKGILKLFQKKYEIIELGINGIYYKKNHLPERRLLLALSSKNILALKEAENISKLSDNEFKVSLGVLKKKELIEIKNGKIILKSARSDLSEKTPEEIFIEQLPLKIDSLNEEQKQTLKELKNRKDIINLKEGSTYSLELTEIGKEIAGKELKIDSIEEITPEIIKKFPKNKKFRKYDIKAPVPLIHGGKRHFVNTSIKKAKKIWLEMGFKEMNGDLTVTSFWNFDALFTSQDHPVREMHDTFFIKKITGDLPDKKIVEKVRLAHEKGINGSRGWNYNWKESEARKVLLRTHTTCLSAMKLVEISKKNLPQKYFAIGKVFRNETVDWSHGFEFNQSEGIVIDANANFRHLIGYLKEFAEKMGYKKFRIQPAYFPYTEPSLEGAVWNEEKKKWVEVIAAGIFRPEVTMPLMGMHLPVLAWGPGFDRLMMEANNVKDLRELYKNDLRYLRNKKIIVK